MSSSEGITNKQKRVLRFLYDFRSFTGGNPTLNEIVVGAGLSSNRSAINMILALVRAGYLEQEQTVTKSTKLTDKGLELVRMPVVNRDSVSKLFIAQISSVPVLDSSSQFAASQNYVGYMDTLNPYLESTTVSDSDVLLDYGSSLASVLYTLIETRRPEKFYWRNRSAASYGDACRQLFDGCCVYILLRN